MRKLRLTELNNCPESDSGYSLRLTGSQPRTSTEFQGNHV